MLKKIAGLALGLAILAGLPGCMINEEPPANLNLSMDRPSNQKLFQVQMQQQSQPVAINKIHSWTIKLTTADGQPVRDAQIAVGGGMPQHGHGLPTQPQVSKGKGDGEYVMEGMKFSMTGWWEIKLDIQAGQGKDQITFNTVIPRTQAH